MSANYRPDLSPYGVVIPPDPPAPVKLPPVTVSRDILTHHPYPEDIAREALETALENASKPLPGSTALRIYLEQQTREAAAEAVSRGLDHPTYRMDLA